MPYLAIYSESLYGTWSLDCGYCRRSLTYVHGSNSPSYADSTGERNWKFCPYCGNLIRYPTLQEVYNVPNIR